MGADIARPGEPHLLAVAGDAQPAVGFRAVAADSRAAERVLNGGRAVEPCLEVAPGLDAFILPLSLVIIVALYVFRDAIIGFINKVSGWFVPLVIAVALTGGIPLVKFRSDPVNNVLRAQSGSVSQEHQELISAIAHYCI